MGGILLLCLDRHSADESHIHKYLAGLNQSRTFFWAKQSLATKSSRVRYPEIFYCHYISCRNNLLQRKNTISESNAQKRLISQISICIWIFLGSKDIMYVLIKLQKNSILNELRFLTMALSKQQWFYDVWAGSWLENFIQLI